MNKLDQVIAADPTLQILRKAYLAAHGQPEEQRLTLLAMADRAEELGEDITAYGFRAAAERI